MPSMPNVMPPTVSRSNSEASNERVAATMAFGATVGIQQQQQDPTIVTREHHSNPIQTANGDKQHVMLVVKKRRKNKKRKKSLGMEEKTAVDAILALQKSSSEDESHGDDECDEGSTDPSLTAEPPIGSYDATYAAGQHHHYHHHHYHQQQQPATAAV